MNRAVEEATDQEVSDYYYNWHCGMCNAFSGTPHPKDYPRGTYGKFGVSYTLNGEHMCFYEVEKYAKARLGELPDV